VLTMPYHPPPSPSHRGRGFRKPSPLAGEGRARENTPALEASLILTPMPPSPSHRGRGFRKPSPLAGEGRVRGNTPALEASLISTPMPPSPSHRGRGFRKPSPLAGEGRVRGECAAPEANPILTPMPSMGGRPFARISMPFTKKAALRDYGRDSSIDEHESKSWDGAWLLGSGKDSRGGGPYQGNVASQ